MKLHELKAVEGSTKARKRIGHDLVLVLVKLQVKVKKDKTLEVAVE